MAEQRTRIRRASPNDSGADAEAPQQSSGFRDQVSAYGDLAREVYADCKKGAEAQREINARRNTSAE
ncbi:MAG: hypothetical protein HUU20_26660 [Pirellulales bacterium]|nr:hypothetical protein [Pirellulales bacterium]